MILETEKCQYRYKNSCLSKGMAGQVLGKSLSRPVHYCFRDLLLGSYLRISSIRGQIYIVPGLYLSLVATVVLILQSHSRSTLIDKFLLEYYPKSGSSGKTYFTFSQRKFTFDCAQVYFHFLSYSIKHV